jgi:hypothetical protein
MVSIHVAVGADFAAEFANVHGFRQPMQMQMRIADSPLPRLCPDFLDIDVW